MRDLPISIAAPIRASSPLWTLIGAMIFMGELPTVLQLGGMVLILAGFFIFSAAGGKEGFSWKSRSMIWLFAGTLFGSCSALYDKFLLNTMELDREVVQLYFSIDLVVLLGCALLVMRLKKTGYSFKWRWSIPATGILLILSDWFYFYTVGLPDIQISVISMVRRCSCVVSFGIGVWLFKDKNIKRKAFALALILTGVIILALAR